MKVTKLDDHLLEQMLENNDKFSIIEHYGFTKNEVKLVVKEWYFKCYLPTMQGVIQDKYGNDLEELLDLEF